MRKVFCLLVLVSALLFGSLTVMADPFGLPSDNASQIIILDNPCPAPNAD